MGVHLYPVQQCRSYLNRKFYPILKKIAGYYGGTCPHILPDIRKSISIFPTHFVVVDTGNLIPNQICYIDIALLSIHNNNLVLGCQKQLAALITFNSKQLYHL